MSTNTESSKKQLQQHLNAGRKPLLAKKGGLTGDSASEEDGGLRKERATVTTVSMVDLRGYSAVPLVGAALEAAKDP